MMLLKAWERTNWPKSVMEEICFGFCWVFVKKRVICYQISDSRDREKTDKIRSMSKKGHQKLLALKWNFFPNRSFGPRKSFSVSPQTRRQVSTYATYHHWLQYLLDNFLLLLLLFHCLSPLTPLHATINCTTNCTTNYTTYQCRLTFVIRAGVIRSRTFHQMAPCYSVT